VHLEVALIVHKQVLTPAEPAVDNLDVHLDVCIELALEVHKQVLTQQSSTVCDLS
jgi:hypothetical protein